MILHSIMATVSDNASNKIYKWPEFWDEFLRSTWAPLGFLLPWMIIAIIAVFTITIAK